MFVRSGIVTSVKVAAIAALLIAAPWAWAHLVEVSFWPQGAMMTWPTQCLYLACYVLTLATIVLAPFFRNAWLRALLSALVLLPFLVDQVILVLSGENVNGELISLLWMQRANAGDAISFWPEAVPSVLFVIGLAIAFLAKPSLKTGLSAAWLGIPILGLALTYQNVNARDGIRARPLPILGGPLLLLKAFAEPDLYAGPRDAVVYDKPIAPEIKNIVLVVDESVTGSMIGINDSRYDNTPVLQRLVDDRDMLNFGEASAMTNCSSATRLSLRVGMTEADLPDSSMRGLHRPTFFDFAKRAGFETSYIDGFRPALQFHSYMNTAETRSIDRREAMGSAPTVDMDNEIARNLLTLLDRPRRQFIFVEKVGVHYPHTGRYLPEGFDYQPSGVDAYSRQYKLDPGQREMVTNYLKSIDWRVDHFFSIIAPALRRPDTVVIYTSDHGQSLFQKGNRAFHCNTRQPTREEASVPLLVGTGDIALASRFGAAATALFGKATQFRIFPTVLALMGYDEDFVQRGFGLSLLSTASTGMPRRFLKRDPFIGVWQDFDGDQNAADGK